MVLPAPAPSVADHVRRLLAEYADTSPGPAYFLCDRHEPSAVAMRFVRRDLSVEVVSFGELTERSRRLAADLEAAGIRPGDRVATLMGKSVEFVVALVAIWRAGAVHVPLFTAFGGEAVVSRLTEARAVAVIYDTAQRQKVELPALDASDLFVRVECALDSSAPTGPFRLQGASRPPLDESARRAGDGAMFEIFTSGTTGRPKGVVVPQKALAALVAYEGFGLDLREGDVFWCAADPGWAYGLWYGVTAPLALGRAFILAEGNFDPTLTWRILTDLGVTNFCAAPTIYRALRVSDRPPDAEPNLRCAASAGEPLTPEINAWAVGALGLHVRDHYGQTELGMILSNHAHPALARPIRDGSMGHPMPGWSVEILEPDADVPAPTGTLGRVAVRVADSPLMWFQGYSGDPDATAARYVADGTWFLTGDSAARDSDGYVHFSARADDVIIMAGYRIGPVDLEAIINSHPAVAECAIVAAPDAMRGEVVEAFVVLRAGETGSDDLADELKQLVRDRYGAHAYPRRVHFEASLPKTPSGKIQRNTLRARRREETERSASAGGA